jgi:hypothetical protein
VFDACFPFVSKGQPGLPEPIRQRVEFKAWTAEQATAALVNAIHKDGKAMEEDAVDAARGYFDILTTSCPTMTDPPKLTSLSFASQYSSSCN